MAKLRCLQIITRSDWAGGQKVLYSLVYGLKQFHSNEIEVEVACGKENGMLIPELEKINVKVHVVDNLVREISPLKDIKAYFEIKKLIRKGGYDIVHTHSSKAGVLGRIAARRVKVNKIIHTVHGWWGIEQYGSFRRKLLLFTEKVAARYCDYIVFLCNRDLEKAKNWKIGKDSQYVIIHNAIIPEQPAPKGLLRKELNIPENIKIIGNVARLDSQKNPIRFLNIAREVIKQKDNVVFVWIGGSVVENSYGKRIKEYLNQNPELKNKVYFLPFRKDAPKLMADFDVFLLTSDSEGMPLVVLEALNQRVPVVSTDVGCVGEMNGVVVGKNEEDIKNKLLTLLEKGPSLKNIGDSTFRSFIDSYIRLYTGRDQK